MSKSQSNIDRIKQQLKKANSNIPDTTASQPIVEQPVKSVHADLIDTKKTLKSKKPKFEDTHKRDTVWIRNDLKEILDDNCVDRGDKTRIINEALEQYLLLK